MGGRGSKTSGKQNGGFSVNVGGKTMEVQRTEAGVVLINGKYTKGADYNKLLKNAKKEASFKALSEEYFKQKQADYMKRRSEGDNELLVGIGTSGRIAKRIPKMKRG